MCAGAGRRSRFRRKVPEGSGGFRRVPACGGVGSGEGSGVCWCRFRRVPVCAGVGSGGKFRRVPVCAGGGKFRRVPVCAGVGSGGKFRKVPEGSGVCWCRFRR